MRTLIVTKIMAVTMTAMFVAPVSATASDRQIPSGYYNGLDGKAAQN